MKNWNAEEIRQKIAEAIPEGFVIPRHDSRGHFYEIDLASKWPTYLRFYEDGYILPSRYESPGRISGVMNNNPVYPSVTGKLQRLKDEGLVNYKMNRAVEYVFGNWRQFTEANVMEHLDLAKRVSVDILTDAGDVGTRIHDMREKIFRMWIASGVRPISFESYIPEMEKDVRVISAMRALEKFCIEQDYIPVALELRVYSHELKTGGSLDDIGLMKKILKEGTGRCAPGVHETMSNAAGKHKCVACGYSFCYELVLMDLKSSNQFKDHYFLQVSLYWKFFTKLTGIKPERCFILKVSKTDGSYKIEDLKKPAKIAQYASALIKVDEGIEFIKSLRQDNQKVVLTI